MDGRGDEGDLIVISLPGVQRFIDAAQSTGDLRAGSEMVAGLAWVAARSCRDQGARLVFPAVAEDQGTRDGVPNRVVALTTEASAPADEMARRACAEVREEWRRWLRRVFRLGENDPDIPDTPGMPLVHWVCVTDVDGAGYRGQWDRARRLLTARRLVRDFTQVGGDGKIGWHGRELCTLSPQWPAETTRPPGLKPHEQARLSAANWVKRRWRHARPDEEVPGFPSTASIASAPYRAAVLERAQDGEVAGHLAALREAAGEVGTTREEKIKGLSPGAGAVQHWFAQSGGPWVYEDRWEADSLARQMGVSAKATDSRFRAAVEKGRRAARGLTERMKATPSAHLAVLVADLDGLGRFLGGQPAANDTRCEVTVEAHRAVSRRLRDAAADHSRLLESTELLAVPVYAGGDDLLAFVPALTALTAARRCHDVVETASLPTTSTAVLFFHYGGSLQAAVSQARELLEMGKKRLAAKHALALGYQRRSGASAASVQPWFGPDGRNAAELFEMFSRRRPMRLSPRLLTDLERDEGELGMLAIHHEELYRRELTRLVERHLLEATDPDETRREASRIAAAIDCLGRAEAAPVTVAGRAGTRPVSPRRPEPAARVAVFLRQEAR